MPIAERSRSGAYDMFENLQDIRHGAYVYAQSNENDGLVPPGFFDLDISCIALPFLTPL
jgi:hypothetical protein